MKWRWILLLALMLSVGVNLGTLIAVWRQPASSPPAAPQAPAAQPVPAVPGPVGPTPAAATSAEPPPVEEVVVKPRSRPLQPRPAEREIPQGPVPGTRTGEPQAAPPAGRAEVAPEPQPPQVPIGPADSLPRGGPGGARVGVPPPAFDRLAAELGLTGEERERFFAGQRLHVEAGRALQGRLQRSRIELAKLLTNEPADGAATERLLREQAELQAALDRELTAMLVEARAMLRPEQYRRYARIVLTRLVQAGPGGPRPLPPQRRPAVRRPRRFD